MRLNPYFKDSETTQLMEEGWLEVDGVTPTDEALDAGLLDPITELLIEEYAP